MFTFMFDEDVKMAFVIAREKHGLFRLIEKSR